MDAENVSDLDDVLEKGTQIFKQVCLALNAKDDTETKIQFEDVTKANEIYMENMKKENDNKEQPENNDATHSQTPTGNDIMVPSTSEQQNIGKETDEHIQDEEWNTNFKPDSVKYSELVKFLEVHSNEIEVFEWVKFLSSKTSWQDFSKTFKHFCGDKISAFSSKFFEMDERVKNDIRNFVDDKCIVNLIDMCEADVNTYFKSVAFMVYGHKIYAENYWEKIDPLGREKWRREDDYLESIVDDLLTDHWKIIHDIKIRQKQNHWFGKFIPLRKHLQGLPIKKGELKILEKNLKYTTKTEDEVIIYKKPEQLFFMIVEELLNTHSTDNGPFPLNNVLQAVHSILAELCKVKSTIKTKEQFDNFLKFFSSDDQDLQQIVYEFMYELSESFEFNVSNEKKELLHRKYPTLLSTVEGYGIPGELECEPFSVLASFLEFMGDTKIDDNSKATQKKLETFLNDAFCFVKRRQCDKTEETFTSDFHSHMIDYVSGNLAVYIELPMEINMLLYYGNIWKGSANRAIAAIDRVSAPLILDIYMGFKKEAVQKLILKNTEGMETAQALTFTGSTVKQLVMSYEMIGFQFLEEAIHHFAKHPHMKVKPPIDCPKIVHYFYLRTKEKMYNAKKVHFEIRKDGVAIYFAIHSNFKCTPEDILVDPKNIKGKINGTVIFFINKHNQLYLSTSY